MLDLEGNNDLGTLVAARHCAFGWLHGNKPLVDKAVTGTLIGVGLLFVLWGIRHWLRYRIRSNVR